jgi:pimeloyl-ACP methyl ester carboxylesterase
MKERTMNLATTGVDAFVRAGDVRLHYVRDRGGPVPLVLLHGLTANARFFEPLVRAGLARRHDVLRLDLRGRGLSDQPATGYRIADHAADVLALLDALGIEQAVIGGHSYGALVTLWLAAHHPERVRRQILMDIAGPTIHNYETFRLIQPSLERLGRVFPSMDDYLAHVRQLPWLDGGWSDDLLPYFRADVELRPDGTVRPRASSAAIAQVIVEAQRERWPEIVAAARLPALVVHAPGPFGPPGTSPIVTRAQAEDLIASLPDARYLEVAGNHVTMLTGARAAPIVAAIETFTAPPTM